VPYSRPQLRLLLGLATVFLVGIAVREWRAGFPDAALRLERFDRDEPAASPGAPVRAERRAIAPTPPEAAGAGRARSGSEAASAGSNTASGSEAEGAGGPAARPEAGAVLPAAAPADPRPLDLNRATLGELARLPGVGPGLAQRILEERDRRGRFDSPEALRQVMGVGPKKLSALRALVTVGE